MNPRSFLLAGGLSFLLTLSALATVDTRGVFLRDGTAWPILPDPTANPNGIPQPPDADPNDWVDPYALPVTPGGGGTGTPMAPGGPGYVPTGSGSGTGTGTPVPVSPTDPLFPTGSGSGTGSGTGTGSGSGTGGGGTGTPGPVGPGSGSGSGSNGSGSGSNGGGGGGIIGVGGAFTGSGSQTGDAPIVGAKDTCAEFAAEIRLRLVADSYNTPKGDYTCRSNGNPPYGSGFLAVQCRDGSGNAVGAPTQEWHYWITQYAFNNLPVNSGTPPANATPWKTLGSWTANPGQDAIREFQNAQNQGATTGDCVQCVASSSAATANNYFAVCCTSYSGSPVW
jgi:hypothetical protein